MRQADALLTRLRWQGFSDALITKGLLGLLIAGLNGLTPQEVAEVIPEFIEKKIQSA